MTPSPLLSLVIPISKPARYLENLSELFNNEDFAEVEVILIHDLQPEEASNTLEDFLSQYPKINLKLIKGYFGSPGAARNAGIRLSTAKWLAFCDADDYLRVTTVKKIIDKSSLRELIIGQFVRENIVNKTKSISRTEQLNQVWIDPGFWRMVYKLDRIKNCKFPNTLMGEDLVFLCQVLSLELNTEITNEIIYYYRVGDSQQSTARVELYNQFPHSIQEIINLGPEVVAKPSSQRIITRLAISQFQYAIHHRKISQSIRSLLILVKNFRYIAHFLLLKKLGNRNS